MKINSSQLEAFFAVGKNLNFTKAADAIGVTQSALSQRIAKLESDLETTLFIRDRTSVRLTEMGEFVLRYCQTTEIAENELLVKLKGSKTELSGTLRIGGFSSVNRSILMPALQNLMKTHAKLGVQVITREIKELESLLKSAEVDYILTNQKSLAEDIENIFLGYEDNVLVKLKNAPNTNVFLDHDESDPTTKSYFRQNKLNFNPSNMRYLDDVYGLLDGVKQGYGKAVLPIHLIENDKYLEVINPKQTLQVKVYLQFYRQPYYRYTHDLVVRDIETFFRNKLRQEK